MSEPDADRWAGVRIVLDCWDRLGDEARAQMHPDVWDAIRELRAIVEAPPT